MASIWRAQIQVIKIFFYQINKVFDNIVLHIVMAACGSRSQTAMIQDGDQSDAASAVVGQRRRANQASRKRQAQQPQR